MRLDKYLSNATDLSRTEVRRLIKAEEVTVDEVVASNPAQKVSGIEDICIDGSAIHRPEHRYFMLHKPAGVVSANKDNNHPTAIDLIHEHRHQDLQIAGRLDIDTTGLILVTDDGQWNHAVTSPRSQCKKTYRVAVDTPLEKELITAFSRGIWLENEKRRCLPAELEILASHHARLTISEGKYHQVKRMFTATGHHVVELHRERIGDIVLDDSLPPGDYRPLTQIEIDSVSSHD